MAVTHLVQEQSAARHLEPPEDLSRRFGGLVVVEYLMELFGDSPKKLFSRIDVLAVLEGVKKDRALFPEAVVAISDRIKAEGKRCRSTSPKSLGVPTHRKATLN